MTEIVTDIVNAIAVYGLLWWMVLFTILPWKTTGLIRHLRKVGSAGSSTGDNNNAGIGSGFLRHIMLPLVDDPADDSKPNVLLKFALTSVIALVLFVLYFAVINSVEFDRYDLLQIHRWLGISVPNIGGR